MGVECVWVGVNGRGNNHGNRWRDLVQIWLARFPHARVRYRLCDCVMGAERWRGMGVGGRANIDLGNRCRDMDQIWLAGFPNALEL